MTKQNYSNFPKGASTLDHAQLMAELGFSVFPLKPNSKEPYTKAGTAAGEEPLAGGINIASKDSRQIGKWFEIEPSINYGVSTTGHCVIDIDVKDKKNGVEEFLALGPLTKTFRVNTPTGGFHDYYKGADCGQRSLSDAIDVRSRNGYVVGPGSVIDGRLYKVVRDIEVAPIPESLAARVHQVATATNDMTAIGELDTDSALANAKALLEASKGIAEHQDGGRDNNAYKLACQVKDLGVSEGMIEALLDEHWNQRNSPPLSEADLRRISRSAYNNGQSAPGSKNPGLEFENLNEVFADDPSMLDLLSSNGPDWPVVNKQGRPISNDIRNVEVFCRWLGVQLSHDEFARKSFVQSKFGPVKELTDEIVDDLWANTNKAGLNISVDALHRMLGVLAREKAFHPVRDYLENLTWDGRPRLDTWLIDVCGAKDTLLNRAFGRKTLIAASRRIFKPGCKFDEMLVLESPQGVGKSSVVRLLAGDKHFTDCVELGQGPKEIIEQTQNAWLVEIPEMAARSTKGVEHIKAQMSTVCDRARPAYGRITKDVPRAFIFIGTTNADKYLHDRTGGRRFWPVKMLRADLSRLLKIRDQLWAEARHYDRAGESLALPKELWGEAGKLQEKRRFVSDIEERITELLAEKSGMVLSEDLWAALGRPRGNAARRTDADKDKIGATMKRLGWDRTRKRAGGTLAYFYAKEPPEGPCPRLKYDPMSDRLVDSDQLKEHASVSWLEPEPEEAFAAHSNTSHH